MSLLLAGGAWLAAGAAIGALYFLALRWNVRFFATGRSVVLAVALQFARFAAMAGLLTIVALEFGALPLLAATAGVLMARTMFLRWGAPP
ncbi:MAG: ATP synthase subunit I [Reyranella sp.]|nr:ATP synthase subunit I [Reyranella sp.]